MSTYELKKFVADGNANFQDRRLALLRNGTWNLLKKDISKAWALIWFVDFSNRFSFRISKRNEIMLNHAEIAFEKQLQMYDVYEEDAKEYDEQSREMGNFYIRSLHHWLMVAFRWFNKSEESRISCITTEMAWNQCWKN